MAEIIIEKFSNDKPNQEAAFIALKQLNNPEFSNCFLKFIKQKSDLLETFQLNSSILYECLNKRISFNSSNTLLLSLMYITELAFDMQTLQINRNVYQQSRISNWKELDALWNDLSMNEKIMSFKIAKWVTNYLNSPNKNDLSKIIENILCCLFIESNALSEIEKWLIYQTDKSLQYFAYYAALQLIIHGSNSSNLFDIIKKNFDCIQKNNFRSLLKRLIESEFVNLSILRQILTLLHENAGYFRQISVYIHRIEVLQLILDLEFEQITSTTPFIIIVKECSYDLRVFLLEYLKKCLENPKIFKEEYIAILCKWMIENSIWNGKKDDFSDELYGYILSLLHNHDFLQIQKAIASGFSFVFTNYEMYEEHLFLRGYGVAHLEQVIFFFDEYSSDILNICLLAFGNYLYLTQKSNRNLKISDELNQALENIFNSSLPEVIIIRAAFCLIIAQRSLPTFQVRRNLFEEKWTLTPEKEYQFLLEKTLFHWEECFGDDYKIEKEIVKHIEKNSSKLLDIFARNFHDYLCDKSNFNYLSPPTVNYVKIAYKAIENNFLLFQKSIQKCIFIRDVPQAEVYQYLYHKTDQSDIEALINVYIMSGVLTNELIDLWKWVVNVYNDEIPVAFTFIKQIDGENVIEKLFEFLYSMVNQRKFSIFENLLCLLHLLAQDSIVSSSELNHHVSIILNDVSDEFNSINWIDQKSTFGTLLEFTSIETINLSDKQVQLFTENDIYDEFMKTIENLEKRPTFFLARNSSSSDMK
ncbi:unnamed protein product [Adineta ricciae]|uniref:Uncharacterized protein n=1 Tax=Adineta ricciae TaxID=249248 RepID=A0A815XMN1_ADIRI|nr:unnamed protein product [Adineta ricciae]